MSFIYCRKCDWEQDDFYSWKLRRHSYNPVSKNWAYLKWLWWPHMIDFGGDPVEGGRHQFSWAFWWRHFIKTIKHWRNMKWTKRADWIADVRAGKAFCPKCGASDWSED